MKMQIAHNDFVDKHGEMLWFNLDGSTHVENADGTEVQ